MATPAPRWNVTAITEVALAVVALGFLLHVLWRCRYGLDFSDEGSYLNDIAAPWLDAHAISQYGSFYHPLYRLFGRDVVLLRQVNVASTYTLAVSLAYLLLRRHAGWNARGVVADWGTALTIGASALSMLAWWLPTPNYNSLVLQGLLLTGCGLACTIRGEANRLVIGAILIGVGGALTFLGKPSTASALAVAMLPVLAVVAVRPVEVTAMAAISAMVVLLAAAFLIDGSPFRFANRIRTALDDAAIFQPVYTIGRLLSWDVLTLLPAQWTVLNWAVGLASVVGCVLCWMPAGARSLVLPGLGAAAALAVIFELGSGCAISCWFASLLADRMELGFFAYPVALGLCASALLVGWRSILTAAGLRALAVTLLLLVLPMAAALGSNDDLWRLVQMDIVFWALAPIPVTLVFVGRPQADAMLVSLAGASLLLTSLIVGKAMEQPYRQPIALKLQTEPVAIGPDKSSVLRLDPRTASYLRDLDRAAQAAGFRPGTPILDMTGGHPGTIYALAGRAVGMSWMIGSYPGSDGYVARKLARVPCEELARAWVLSGIEARRALGRAVMTGQGLDPWDGYVEVHRTPTTGLDGEHVLWKPAVGRQQAAARCENARHTPASSEPTPR